jgi:hypothetical protein
MLSRPGDDLCSHENGRIEKHDNDHQQEHGEPQTDRTGLYHGPRGYEERNSRSEARKPYRYSLECRRHKK